MKTPAVCWKVQLRPKLNVLRLGRLGDSNSLGLVHLKLFQSPHELLAEKFTDQKPGFYFRGGWDILHFGNVEVIQALLNSEKPDGTSIATSCGNKCMSGCDECFAAWFYLCDEEMLELHSIETGAIGSMLT